MHLHLDFNNGLNSCNKEQQQTTTNDDILDCRIEFIYFGSMNSKNKSTDLIDTNIVILSLQCLSHN